MLGIDSEFRLTASGEYAAMNRMDRGRSMEYVLQETCGTEYTKKFWPRWHRAYLSEEDIHALADFGYNSVRLPIRASTFLYEEPSIQFNEESFAMLTNVLDWCEKYRVYAIIDIHAATAGQSGVPCDNGIDNSQHFYIDEEARERMCILMEEFARRFADRWIIGGYDCLNEPLSITPRIWELTPILQEFYAEMIRRCRVYDKNHLFLLNGTQFSTLVDLFDRDFDPECHNWGISIHQYEAVSPEMVSISDALKKCEEWNVPLWMSETGGRNEHDWQTTMYELLAEHHAGFALWCWKTVVGAGCASIMNFTVPEDWHIITDYALKGGPKPSYERAQKIWDAYLECIRFENCTPNMQYHARFFGRKAFLSQQLATMTFRWIPDLVNLLFPAPPLIVSPIEWKLFMKKAFIRRLHCLAHAVAAICATTCTFVCVKGNMFPILYAQRIFTVCGRLIVPMHLHLFG